MKFAIIWAIALIATTHGESLRSALQARLSSLSTYVSSFLRFAPASL